jgi:hypothetical protein
VNLRPTAPAPKIEPPPPADDTEAAKKQLQELLSKIPAAEMATILAAAMKKEEAPPPPAPVAKQEKEEKQEERKDDEVSGMRPQQKTLEVDVPQMRSEPEPREALQSADFEVIDEPKRSSPPPPPPIPLVVKKSDRPIAPQPVVEVKAPPAPEPPPSAVVPASAPPRVSIPDPMDMLFDAMYDLRYFETAIEGASYVLASTLKAMPARAGIVHLYDVEKRELAVVYAQGPEAAALLGKRTRDDEWIVEAAIAKRKPLTLTFGGNAPTKPPPRYTHFGSPFSVIVAPVIHWGRCLAMIELIDPLEEVGAENALAYVAEHYSEFLGDRGVDLNEVVAPPQNI